MATEPAATTDLTTGEGVRRRDWIHIAAISTAGVGGASVLLPLISQMSPSADVLAASTTEVDVSAIQAGQSIKAVFRKQPLFVKRLTAEEIAKAKADDSADMRDPATFADRIKPATRTSSSPWACAPTSLRPAGCRRRREQGRVRRLFLPLPRLALRCCRPDPQRPGTQEPSRAGLHFQVRHRHPRRLSQRSYAVTTTDRPFHIDQAERTP